MRARSMTGRWHPVPLPHQRLDPGTIFACQPVRQFPEHDLVDAPECARCEVGELVERRPARQLTVQAGDHVHRGNFVITGERFDQSVTEGPGFLSGDRGDHGHASARSPFANDPVPQKNEPVIDVCNMALIHIQRQFQSPFQKVPAFFTDGFGLRLGALDGDNEVIGITAVPNGRRLPLAFGI